jgi:hypothetical protein
MFQFFKSKTEQAFVVSVKGKPDLVRAEKSLEKVLPYYRQLIELQGSAKDIEIERWQYGPEGRSRRYLSESDISNLIS